MHTRPLFILALGTLATTAALAARPYDPNRDVQIIESTDPARIAEIERHAEELRAKQQLNGQTGASGTSSARDRNRRARSDRG